MTLGETRLIPDKTIRTVGIGTLECKVKDCGCTFRITLQKPHNDPLNRGATPARGLHALGLIWSTVCVSGFTSGVTPGETGRFAGIA